MAIDENQTFALSAHYDAWQLYEASVTAYWAEGAVQEMKIKDMHERFAKLAVVFGYVKAGEIKTNEENNAN